MSDFYEAKEQERTEFVTQLMQKLEGNKLQLNYSGLRRFPKGWYQFILGKIDEVKSLSIDIDMLRENFGKLEIHYNNNKSNKLIRFVHWKEEIEKDSESLCMGCGESGYRKVLNGKVVVICSACKKGMDDRGETGTWLDKY